MAASIPTPELIALLSASSGSAVSAGNPYQSAATTARAIDEPICPITIANRTTTNTGQTRGREIATALTAAELPGSPSTGSA